MLKQLLLLLISFCILSAPRPGHAETKVLTAEGTYTMGEGETMTFAESMALQKAKQMALEQAGTYVESYTKVQNYQLTADEIQTIAGGVLQVEVLDKTRTLVGDGLKFFVKIKATVTTDKVSELAQRIKGKNVAEEYKKLQEDYAKLNQEIEKWKQLVAKTPAGPEREAALDQIREREKAFTGVQKSELAFFHRLVSGEDLVNQGMNEQTLLDGLFKKVLGKGHQLTVGQPKILPMPSNPDQASVFIPLTLISSQDISLVFKDATSRLGGTIQDSRPLWIEGSNTVLGNSATHSDLYNTTLIRIAKDIETSRYLQERINNLALSVELADSKNLLAKCSLRYYDEARLPIPEHEATYRAELIDQRIRLLGTIKMLMEREDVKEYYDMVQKLDDVREKLDNQVRKNLSEKEKSVASKRRKLYGRSHTSGVFMRLTPVESRLTEGGMYGVGRPSNKSSRRQEDNGFVAVLHDPATLKLEFTLPQDKAKNIESVRASVIEMTAEEWERLDDKNRRSGPGNLNKLLSGESATVDGPTGR